MDEQSTELLNCTAPSTTLTNDVPIERLLEHSLRFECVDAGTSEVKGLYSTGWRTLPFTVVNHWMHSEVRFDVVPNGQVAIPSGDCFVIPLVYHTGLPRILSRAGLVFGLMSVIQC